MKTTNYKALAVVLATCSLLVHARADIITGLQAYYPLDDGSGSSTARDFSGNSNTGVLTSFADTTYTSMWTNGNIGGALIFNANGVTSNYVSVANSTNVNFDVSRAFTLAAWVYLNVDGSSQSNGAAILCKGVPGLESYSLDITGGRFRVLTRNTNGKSQQTVAALNTTPVAGTWYHVVGVWNRSPQIEAVYINGALDSQYTNFASGFLTTSFVTNHALTIGCKETSATSGYNIPFQGRIDEVRLYNRVLSADDINELYTNTSVTVVSVPPTVSQPIPSKAGSSVVFNVTASGIPAPAYQWYFNTNSNYSGATSMTDGNGVSGSTTSSLTITNLQNYYFVVVTNASGSATSAVVAAGNQLSAVSAGKPIWNQASQTNVIVTFSEGLLSDMLDATTATTVANYSLNNGASVLSAALGGPNEVVLATSVLNPATSYTLTVQNVKEFFGATMSPSPTDIAVGVYPANLVLWVRADTGVTTDANGVTQWNDLSGNNNTIFGGGGPAIQPQLVTNAWGDPVIRFNTTDTVTNYMATLAGSPTLGIINDMSIIAVINVRTLASGRNGHIVSKTGSTPHANIPAPYDYSVAATGGPLLRGNGNGTVNGFNFGSFAATNGPSLGYPYVVAVSETGNTVSHYLNGQAVGTGLLSNGFLESNDFDQGQQVYIGARSDGFNRLAGDLAELIVAGSPVSAYGVAALDNYLSAQHHFVLFNPSQTNLVVSSLNNQLTLSWPADHTGWQLQSNSVGLQATGAWFPVSGSTLTNRITIAPDASQTSVFYRMILQQP